LVEHDGLANVLFITMCCCADQQCLSRTALCFITHPLCMRHSSTASQLFFNPRTHQFLRLPTNSKGLCLLDIGNRTFHLPVQALELLHYHPVSIDPMTAPSETSEDPTQHKRQAAKVQDASSQKMSAGLARTIACQRQGI